MNDPHDHPDYRRALDRRLPIAERKASYAAWADDTGRHLHPQLGRWHSHPGGASIHTHPEKE